MKYGAWQLIALACAGGVLLYSLHIKEQQHQAAISPAARPIAAKRSIELTLADFDIPAKAWEAVNAHSGSTPVIVADAVLRGHPKTVHNDHFTTIDGQMAINNSIQGAVTPAKTSSSVSFQAVSPRTLALTPQINADNTITVNIMSSNIDDEPKVNGNVHQMVLTPHQYQATVVLKDGQSTIAHEESSSHDNNVRVAIVTAKIQPPI